MLFKIRVVQRILLNESETTSSSASREELTLFSASFKQQFYSLCSCPEMYAYILLYLFQTLPLRCAIAGTSQEELGPCCGAKWQTFLQSMSIKLPASDTLRTKAWISQLSSGREFNVPLARVETKISTILGCYDSLLPQQYCSISRLFKS